MKLVELIVVIKFTLGRSGSNKIEILSFKPDINYFPRDSTDCLNSLVDEYLKEKYRSSYDILDITDFEVTPIYD